MRFEISRETMLKLLRMVSGAVERRHQVPILSNVLLRATSDTLSLIATDQEVELVGEEQLATIHESGATTVPFRKLSELCKALPEGAELLFDVQADRALIKSGRSRFTLATLPADQFPDVQQVQDVEHACKIVLPKKQFRWLVVRTAFAMAEQDVRYFLNGMLLEVKNDKLFAVAADGHRLAMNYLDLTESGLPARRVIVPRKGILEIMRMLDEDDHELTITLFTNQIRAQSRGVTITTRLLEGKFPDYERVIPRDGTKVVVGNREKLKEAFHRASALFSEKFRGVRLRMSQSSLMVLASNPEQDEVEEDLEVEYEGQDIEVGFNVRYLIDFLSVVQSETVRFTFSDSNKSTLIEEVGGQGGAYVLMPIRT